MLLIELRFPAGRFHATPWGRNVNEGIPEWPPSPYRLVRGLYDLWKRKRPGWPEERVEPLLEALASSLPMFRLPLANASHTRAWLSENTTNPSDRKLIFDAFVVLDPDVAVLMGWPDVTLDAPKKRDLDELLSLLNFLGRSESWLSSKIVPDAVVEGWNCFPLEGHAESDDSELVRVACAIPRGGYHPPPKPSGRGGKSLRSGEGWLEALTWSTEDVRQAKVSGPPAMRNVEYLRPSPCFGVALRSPTRRRRPVHGVVYALSSKTLPRVTATVEISDRVRKKLMGIHRVIIGDASLVSSKFSGKDKIGAPLTGHRHAYILPQDRDRDGRLDHLVVVSREPLDEGEELALDRMRSVWQSGGRPDLLFTPLQWGSPAELFPPVLRVTSATPFVLTRHYRKGRGDFGKWLAGEVRREARNQGLPEPIRVIPVSHLRVRGRTYRWIEFRRNRKGDLPAPGFGFQLEFPEPVNGPIALGYGSHFGLGLFVSAGDPGP